MMALCFGFCTLSCTRSILLTAAVVFCCCNGNDSCHEHPQRATSWQRESVRRVMQCPTVQTVIFDQCRVGLKTPDSKQPLCKRTTLLTNSPAIVSSFSPLQCNCQVEHGIIQGSEAGVQWSKYCHVYTPELVELLAKAVRQQFLGTQ